MPTSAAATVGLEKWAKATAFAFNTLQLKECAEVAKPEWWNEEELKALSARVVRAAPNVVVAVTMRATVLTWQCGAWEAGPRSAAELKEAATLYDRSAALSSAPMVKAEKPSRADLCRSMAEVM